MALLTLPARAAEPLTVAREGAHRLCRADLVPTRFCGSGTETFARLMITECEKRIPRLLRGDGAFGRSARASYMETCVPELIDTLEEIRGNERR